MTGDSLWGVHMDAGVGTKPIDKGYVGIGWPEVGERIVFKLAQCLRDHVFLWFCEPMTRNRAAAFGSGA